ncbi:MAG TPA: hypothetical protein VFN53_03770 [Acidobacteriaceae bacterium]|nr:hypothetical protein [Acidobacteriaceae bacterium]
MVSITGRAPGVWEVGNHAQAQSRIRGPGRVNILKKVKVRAAWNFYPAVIESNGKLKDKVRVKGAIEVHPEGQYFIEWWEGPSRRREQILEHSEVLEHARENRLHWKRYEPAYLWSMGNWKALTG